MAERDKLIELAYDAIEDPRRWNVFLSAFCETMKADLGLLSLFYPQRGQWDVTYLVGGTQEDLREYQEKWQDPWASGDIVHRIPVGQIQLSHLLCPDEVLEQLDVYKEFLAARNGHYGGGVVLDHSHHQRSLLSFCRAKSKGRLDEREVSFWQDLVPYLQRAIRLSGELAALRAEREMLAAFIDELPTPLFLINRLGSVIHANDAADRFLRGSASLSREGSQLKWTAAAAQSQFLEALDTVCGKNVDALGGGVQLRFERESGRPPLLVLVNPTGAGQPRVGTDQAMAAVYVIDPGSARLVNENHLRELFGLTPAEAAIAALLTQGCTAEEAAERTGVTMNTIRTHLKRTLEKTGCRRQAELVALVLRTSA